MAATDALGIVFFAAGLIIFVIEVWIGWGNLISMARGAKEETTLYHETDPVNTVYHELPDGRVMKLQGFKTIRRFNLGGSRRPLEFRRCYYDQGTEEPDSDHVWEVGEAHPANPECWTNSDGAYWKIRLGDADAMKKENEDLQKDLQEISEKLGVKEVERTGEAEEFNVKMNKFGDQAERMGKKTGKVSVTPKPGARRESLTSGEFTEGGETSE